MIKPNGWESILREIFEVIGFQYDTGFETEKLKISAILDQAILSAEEAKTEAYKEGFKHGWESRSYKMNKEEERELTKNIIDQAISAISNKK